MTVKKMMNYRSVWMGFAMLWVMIFHAEFIFKNSAVMGIKSVGYGGVDIFLFASGMGNYFSYFKDENPLEFLKRRIMRLAPVYVPFIVVWSIYKIVMKEMNPFYFFGNLFGVEGLSHTGKNFNWYLTALVICYVLTPYIANAVKKNSIYKNLMLVVILFLISTAFFFDTRSIISYSRLPIYAIGMIFAKYSDKEIKWKEIVIGAVMFIVGCVALYIGYTKYPDYLWNYGIHWYPFIFITPFLCYALSAISEMISKWKVVEILLNGLKYVGNISFELYLAHIFIFSDVSIYLKNKGTTITNGMWLAMYIAAFPGAILINCVSKVVNNILKSRVKK